MSIYYKQNFVSPLPLYAEVKEDLRSYFASGIIDDVMFPKWTEHCLKRLRKSAFKIEEIVLKLSDYKAELPCDFQGVREAWLRTITYTNPLQQPSAIYFQTDCRVDIPARDACAPCQDTEGCTTEYMVVNKQTTSAMYGFRRTVLLRPGNINTLKHCGECCPNISSSSTHTFDIHDGYLVTNVCEGDIHLLYYSSSSIEDEDQLVPDDFWVHDYIRKYLIYRCFNQLCNIVTDETYNQIERKRDRAKEEQAEAFIIMETELKKQTVSEKMRQIGVLNRRDNVYNIPGDRSNLH